MGPSNSSRTISMVIAAAVFLSGMGAVLAINAERPDLTAEQLFDNGMVEFQASNYGAASELFERSYRGHMSSGENDEAMEAQNMKFRCDRVLLEYGLTREQAEDVLADTFTWVPEGQRSSWLDGPNVEKITSDGEERYYNNIAENIAFRNLSLLHQWRDRDDPDMFKAMMDDILDLDSNRSGTYFNPGGYIADGSLTLPRSELPPTGTLSVWLPAPIGTASQVNVTVVSVEPEKWVKTISTDGDLGQIYMEVPLENLTGDLVIDVTYSYKVYQKHFDIDPSSLGDYNRTSEDYIRYTTSQENIRITPEITAEALQVVGNETNPYLQAKLLYDHVIGTITYSYTPHLTIDALNIGESEYVRTHRFGDCGAQSQYFCALLRSLGVPARSCGGYQSFGGGTGSHFWAEFYLPEYGWIPVDVTAADTVDWIPPGQATEGERAMFKEYFFGNLDRMRYVIQNDADIALDPQPQQSNPMDMAFQNAIVSCSSSEQDLPLMAMMSWNLIITALP
ncbi:MAG: transglutaminase domain-containing protein [Methanomassiliicoccus sp.]|nr:transglutaminase domain-containing protein [Methanomassiliicoccus sp.]